MSLSSRLVCNLPVFDALIDRVFSFFTPAVNGFDKSAKPTTLPALPLVPNQPQLAQSSPVRETNPWAQDARRQLPDQFGNSVTQANSQFGGSSGAPVHTHKRSASEADRWLNSVQMQAQNNAMTALQFQPQPFYNTTQAAKPSDPFQPQTNRPSGFVVNLWLQRRHTTGASCVLRAW